MVKGWSRNRSLMYDSPRTNNQDRTWFILNILGNIYSASLNVSFSKSQWKTFIFKGIEFFLISSLILCFAIDIDVSNSFSKWLYKLLYFKIIFVLFKIMKDLHLFKILYSVPSMFFRIIFFFFFFFGWKIKSKFFVNNNRYHLVSSYLLFI